MKILYLKVLTKAKLTEKLPLLKVKNIKANSNNVQ